MDPNKPGEKPDPRTDTVAKEAFSQPENMHSPLPPNIKPPTQALLERVNDLCRQGDVFQALEVVADYWTDGHYTMFKAGLGFRCVFGAPWNMDSIQTIYWPSAGTAKLAAMRLLQTALDMQVYFNAFVITDERDLVTRYGYADVQSYEDAVENGDGEPVDPFSFAKAAEQANGNPGTPGA